jgi:hypothetical protein
MKQVLYYAVLSAMILTTASCTGPGPSSKTYLDSIPGRAAATMIHHYDDSVVAKGAPNILRYIRLNPDQVEGLSALKGTVTLWTAADTNSHLMRIIAESSDSTGSNATFYALKVIICPPPSSPPCVTSLPLGY